jgi:hypothetical protein
MCVNNESVIAVIDTTTTRKFTACISTSHVDPHYLTCAEATQVILVHASQRKVSVIP